MTQDAPRNVELAVDGMSCEGCQSAVETALSKVPGVRSVEVALESGRARIASEEPVDTAQLIAAVEDAGFEARER